MKGEQEFKPAYDLEERTFQFAKAVRLFIKTLAKTTENIQDAKQLVRASGSVGANYREANEALSPKDFLLRMKISRKEAKESIYWLRLIHETNNLKNANEAERLIQEANELNKDTLFDHLENCKSQYPNCKSQYPKIKFQIMYLGIWNLSFGICLLRSGA